MSHMIILIVMKRINYLIFVALVYSCSHDARRVCKHDNLIFELDKSLRGPFYGHQLSDAKEYDFVFYSDSKIEIFPDTIDYYSPPVWLRDSCIGNNIVYVQEIGTEFYDALNSFDYIRTRIDVLKLLYVMDSVDIISMTDRLDIYGRIHIDSGRYGYSECIVKDSFGDYYFLIVISRSNDNSFAKDIFATMQYD